MSSHFTLCFSQCLGQKRLPAVLRLRLLRAAGAEAGAVRGSTRRDTFQTIIPHTYHFSTFHLQSSTLDLHTHSCTHTHTHTLTHTHTHTHSRTHTQTHTHTH